MSGTSNHPPRHLRSLHDLSSLEINGLLTLAGKMKARPREYRDVMAGRSMAMIFEKASTRTRVSFEVGMAQMGGHAVFLSRSDSHLGRGESMSDTGRTLSRMVDLIMARMLRQSDLEELAEYASSPVINALTDRYHPCQALADMLTLRETFGESLPGRSVAWIGDGNNVSHSFLYAGAVCGLKVVVATPEGYEPDAEVVASAQEAGAATGGSVELVSDPAAAYAEASAVATDVWTSMGLEAEQEERVRAFSGFQVDQAAMAAARSDAVFMHCLPANRGQEVTDEVIDGAHSRVFDQAENRLHAQKAVMAYLVDGAPQN